MWLCPGHMQCKNRSIWKSCGHLLSAPERIPFNTWIQHPKQWFFVETQSLLKFFNFLGKPSDGFILFELLPWKWYHILHLFCSANGSKSYFYNIIFSSFQWELCEFFTVWRVVGAIYSSLHFLWPPYQFSSHCIRKLNISAFISYNNEAHSSRAKSSKSYNPISLSFTWMLKLKRYVSATNERFSCTRTRT